MLVNKNIELPERAHVPSVVPYKDWASSEWDRPANYPIYARYKDT